jgi:hypothetical protein
MVTFFFCKGWRQICTPYGSASDFCSNPSESQDSTGPFIIFNKDVGNTIGLYRCYTGKDHFFSTDPGCEGTKTEYQLGFISKYKNGITLRGLYRCFNRGVGHYHSLDVPCIPQDQDTGIFGYVR